MVRPRSFVMAQQNPSLQQSHLDGTNNSANALEKPRQTLAGQHFNQIQVFLAALFLSGIGPEHLIRLCPTAA